MNTIEFSSITWDAQTVMIPQTSQRYRTHYLYITPVESTCSVEEYLLLHIRNRSVLCSFTVSPNDLVPFKQFQNALLSSKLLTQATTR